MANVLKEAKKNWLVLTFVFVQAIFVVGAKTQENTQMDQRVSELELSEKSDREMLIEMRTDIRWIKKAMEAE